MAHSLTQRARRYRILAISIALAGVAGAGLVYWLGCRMATASDDPSMLGFNRAETRQMTILYGKQGRFYEDLSNGLKQPGTQAMFILAAAGMVAVGCVCFARILENEAKQKSDDVPGVNG